MLTAAESADRLLPPVLRQVAFQCGRSVTLSSRIEGKVPGTSLGACEDKRSPCGRLAQHRQEKSRLVEIGYRVQRVRQYPSLAASAPTKRTALMPQAA